MTDPAPYLEIAGNPYPLEEVLAHLRLTGAWQQGVGRFVEREAVHGIAAEEGLEVPVEELQASIDVFRKMHGLLKADDTERWFAAMGIGLEHLERESEAALLSARLTAGFTAEEVEAAFEEKRSTFDALRLSVLETDNEALARELAQQIEEEEAGFEDLAREHSLDGPTREAGGHLGWVRRPTLAEEVADKLFPAGAGAVVGPLPAGDRHRLYRVEEVRPAALDESTETEVRDLLRQERIARFIQSKGLVENAPWSRSVEGEGA